MKRKLKNEYNKTSHKGSGNHIRQQSQQDWQNYLNFQNINETFQSNGFRQIAIGFNNQQQRSEFKPPLPNCPPPPEPQLPPLPPVENANPDPSFNTSNAVNSTAHSSSSLLKKNDINSGQTTETALPDIVINKKKKGKPMSRRVQKNKDWKLEDAQKALEIELEYNNKQRSPVLILKFPDPEISNNLVKNYSAAIHHVHFQQPCTPRYCSVHLLPGSDIEKVREELCKIPFGTGFITAEKRHNMDEKLTTPAEDIDPYTLYIGNLPSNMDPKSIKKRFPSASRLDVGFAQRMKYTRYAFVRYHNVDDAIIAFKEHFNTVLESRSLIVRFKRQKGSVGMSFADESAQDKVRALISSNQLPDEDCPQSATTDCISNTETLEKFPKNLETPHSSGYINSDEQHKLIKAADIKQEPIIKTEMMDNEYEYQEDSGDESEKDDADALNYSKNHWDKEFFEHLNVVDTKPDVANLPIHLETIIKKEITEPAEEELDDDIFNQMNPNDGFKL